MSVSVLVGKSSLSLDAVTLDEVAEALGISVEGAEAVAGAGLLGGAVAPGLYSSRALDDLGENVWSAALPTMCETMGVPLGPLVEDFRPALWPAVVTALLEGRLNAFRRRGVFSGRILAKLFVASDRVALDLDLEPEGAAPTLWMPLPQMD